MLYERFLTENIRDGKLIGVDFHEPDNFNFAYDVIDALADVSPDKPAMLWIGNDGEERRFSFADVSRESSRTANFFISLGIGKGDKVMLVLKRNYEFWLSVLALHKIGAVVIPATDQLLEKDYVYRFTAGDVKAIVATNYGTVPDEIDKAIAKVGFPKIKILTRGEREGYVPFSQSAGFSAEFPRRDTHKDDIMLMYFTSGTTGYPKIAMHSYTYPLGHFVTARWWHEVDPNGIHLTVSDTGWAKAAWGKIYGQWLCETCLFVYDFDRFNPENVLRMIEKYKVTTFCAPPTMYRFFIKEDLTRFDLSSLKKTTIAGEALNPEVFKQFRALTGLELTEGFGQTESALLLGNLPGMEIKPGSMGKPNPIYEIDLLRPDGKSTETGEVGEIVVKTDKKPYGLFCGYYKAPEVTEEVWHDGYYHTCDTAWRDENGYFWYEGRVDDVIKSSGYRIGPFEIESTLMEHPSVLECAVTGVPDPVRGQIVKATIVLTKGYEPSEELKKEIQNYVKTHTAPYKYPRVIQFVKELPKTVSGKIKRAELRRNDG